MMFHILPHILLAVVPVKCYSFTIFNQQKTRKHTEDVRPKVQIF